MNTKVIIIIVLLALGIGIYFLTQPQKEEKKKDETGGTSGGASWLSEYGTKTVNHLKGWNNLGFYGNNAVWEMWRQIENKSISAVSFGVENIKTYNELLAFYKNQGILTQIR